MQTGCFWLRVTFGPGNCQFEELVLCTTSASKLRNNTYYLRQVLCYIDRSGHQHHNSLQVDVQNMCFGSMRRCAYSNTRSVIRILLEHNHSLKDQSLAWQQRLLASTATCSRSISSTPARPAQQLRRGSAHAPALLGNTCCSSGSLLRSQPQQALNLWAAHSFRVQVDSSTCSQPQQSMCSSKSSAGSVPTIKQPCFHHSNSYATHQHNHSTSSSIWMSPVLTKSLQHIASTICSNRAFHTSSSSSSSSHRSSSNKDVDPSKGFIRGGYTPDMFPPDRIR